MMDDENWEAAKELRKATDHEGWNDNPHALMAVPWEVFTALVNEVEILRMGEDAANQAILKSSPELDTIKDQVEAGDSERIRTVILALESQPLVWGACIPVLQRYQQLAKSIEEGEP